MTNPEFNAWVLRFVRQQNPLAMDEEPRFRVVIEEDSVRILHDDGKVAVRIERKRDLWYLFVQIKEALAEIERRDV